MRLDYRTYNKFLCCLKPSAATAILLICLASAAGLTASPFPVSAETAVLPETLADAGLEEEPTEEQQEGTLAPVQVFDVQEERVLTTRPNSSAFRQQVERWIQAAQQLSGRARLEAEAGLVVRIPMQPRLPIRLSWLSIDVTEVYLFINPEEKENPHLLLFSSEGKPYVIEIQEHPEAFLKEHGLLRYIQSPFH